MNVRVQVYKALTITRTIQPPFLTLHGVRTDRFSFTMVKVMAVDAGGWWGRICIIRRTPISKPLCLEFAEVAEEDGDGSLLDVNVSLRRLQLLRHRMIPALVCMMDGIGVEVDARWA